MRIVTHKNAWVVLNQRQMIVYRGSVFGCLNYIKEGE